MNVVFIDNRYETPSNPEPPKQMGDQVQDYVVDHSLIIGREVLILTLSILLALQGCISWYIPWDGLRMREWPYTASNWDVLGCTSPPTSRFPSALEMSLGLRPRDISRASGNLLVVGDVQPNTSLLSAVYGYNDLIHEVGLKPENRKDTNCLIRRHLALIRSSVVARQ